MFCTFVKSTSRVVPLKPFRNIFVSTRMNSSLVRLEAQDPNMKSPLRFPVLITCEHASNVLPSPYAWEKEDKRLENMHWAIDLGAEDLTVLLHKQWNTDAIIAGVSRLFVDVNRPITADTLCRTVADNNPIVLNSNLNEVEKKKRIVQYYEPYHQLLQQVAKKYQQKSGLCLSVHSFTDQYEGNRRDVEVGILYEDHPEPSHAAVEFLKRKGYDARINEPWSGLDGFMFAGHSVENSIFKGMMIECRQDLLTSLEWRTKFGQDLTELFTSDSAFISQIIK